MAITSEEIHNQSFSIDRKGYDVDEVDVFLEHVADEIDGLNNEIVYLQGKLDESKFDGFDRPAASAASESDLVTEKDARIADLESQLEAKKADDNAIAQALIIAQRSADEIISNANVRAATTIKEAEDEARRIVDKAEADKQKVLDAIKKLEDDREDAREAYKDLLTDFIGDATRKLAEIGETAPAEASSFASSVKAGSHAASSVQAPIEVEATVASYSTPISSTGAVAAAATVVPSGVEKDLSGFGDADDDFEFEEID
ncbi:DivIVA domain-containing protein [Adlercreutzia agrestimuris]|uniref:DivIVA domain-containing protein n=1 Tax=Adlercreutzia agrestimuris TaxID=2941324 RepID=UPI00203BC150|nr:DivIVA domain-containing protein [Adlercreutzia agrestimuris]